MAEKMLYRFHYRGQLVQGVSDEAIDTAIAACVNKVNAQIADNHIMTAALYHYKNMLFFYYEADEADYEPERLLSPLTDYLEKWPSEEGSRNWVKMYHIFCHSYPHNWEDWKRAATLELRRGRITRLYEDKLFSYVYHHKAIVDEGLLTGDRYQSIALHENILFSYFEEPKNIANIKRDTTKPSEAIKDWLAVDPASHFNRYPESQENFLFIPAYFALGEDKSKAIIT